MSRDALGIIYGSTKPFEERVIKNGWLANVFGRALCFSDLGPLEIASIEEHVGPHGAVLVLAEQEAGKLRFGYSESFERKATKSQHKTLGELAIVNGDSSIPQELAKRAKAELPALFTADFAVVENGLYFTIDGGRMRDYQRTLDYWHETMEAAENEGHRQFHIELRKYHLDQGCDLSQLPKASLDDQQREALRDKVAPEINRLYSRAQLLNCAKLDTQQFAISVARHAIRANPDII